MAHARAGRAGRGHLIATLSIAGYRSLRDVRLALGPLTVITGANGSGKSSLYRALRLLADVSAGRVVTALAHEGGLASVLWAGPAEISTAMRRGDVAVQGGRRSGPARLLLGFAADDYGYAIDLGMPAPSHPFPRDPEVKLEALWTGPAMRRATLIAERHGPSVRIRDPAGTWAQASVDIAASDSMMTVCGDPRAAAELLILRERMRDWRFYDHLRTDADAPARARQVGGFTPVLAGDGRDLAAAILTIQKIGDGLAFEDAVADAFAGGQVAIVEADGTYEVRMHQTGLLRPLRAAELSDGTLRFLLLAAALLTPRPPELMVLNEPETSLHPDLLAPLARLLARAATRSQIVVVSHASALIEALDAEPDCRSVRLEKSLGETVVTGHDAPAWAWPSR